MNHRLPAGDIAAILADTEPAMLIQYDTPALPGSVRHRITVAAEFEALIADAPAEPSRRA